MLDTRPLQVPAPLLPFLIQRAPYKVAYGGRGGAKTRTFATMLVLKAYTEPKHLILCTREIQASIADSVHAAIKNEIENLGLDKWFIITDHEITCWLTGSRFIFKGLRHSISAIRSTEGVTITWVEEAQAVSENSWLALIPTVMRTDGAEIWISLNPMDAADPTYKRFVLDPPDDAIVVKINWKDNPWFPAGLERERTFMLRTDPDAYDWVWGGHTRAISAASIFKGRYKVEPFEAPETINRFMYGADWGFAADPSVLMRCWQDDGGAGRKKLMIDYEAYGIGVESDDLGALFGGGTSNKLMPLANGEMVKMTWPGVPNAKDHIIKADNSRPETISFVARQQFNIIAAKKWPGSVEDGLSYLKTYDEIIIHPRCVHMAQEARLYSYKVDKHTGLILPQVDDKHNHCIAQGQLVHTARGLIAIENVVVGDLVHTRAGLKRVLQSTKVAEDRALWQVSAGDHSVLLTNDHEVITANRGLVRADAIRYDDEAIIMDELLCASKVPFREPGNRLNTTAACGIVTPMKMDLSKINTSLALLKTARGRASFIAKCMKATKALYRPAIKCITKMAMLATTCLTISKRSRALRTQSITSLMQEGRTIKSTLRASVKAQSPGTNQKRAWRIIKQTGALAQRSLLALRNVASNVTQLLLQKSATMGIAFVGPLVQANGVTYQGSMISSLYAQSACSPFSVANTGSVQHAPTHALCARDTGLRGAVYDLTVEDQHEFFAGGILVSNCWDAIRYAHDGLIIANGSLGTWQKLANRR